MIRAKNKRILVAPLDWGLGHATRCIPIIQYLVQRQYEVFVAADGPQLALLKAEFANINFLHLPGYGVKYGRRGVFFSLLGQVPAIYNSIQKEHNLLKTLQQQYGFAGIISDNRYGFYHSGVPSVLITHQLDLQLPYWAAPAKAMVRRLLYSFINHFQQVWVPDIPNEEQSLAGSMSHPAILPRANVKCIGWLSRMQPPVANTTSRGGLLFSLSGPEPQRTLLENEVIKALPAFDEQVWLVRGLPQAAPGLPDLPGHVKAYNHLPTDQLQQLMQQCRLMVCRSGYSTLMDALITQTPVATIPTPGQTEQEYLARRLANKKWAAYMPQPTLNFNALINRAYTYTWPAVPAGNTLDTGVLDDWLSSL